MADDTTLNSGSGGDTIATDDIGGVKHQRVKVQYGVDGAATDVSDTNPLPIDDAGGSLTVDNGGTFVVQEDGNALTALQLIDDVVHVDDAAFTLGTDKGVMVMGFAGTQSVNANDAAALACDTDGALHISDGGNTITVDGTVTANAGTGTFTIQEASALDVSAATVTVTGTVTANLGATDNAVLDAIDSNTDYGATTGGGTEAGALRVTIANDSTGVISIDDNGGAITVDGTITANAGTNLNTSSLALESGGNLATVAGAVTGSEMQVDVVAALPAGTNAIGKLAANSGVDIGDVDVTSISAGSNLVGDVGISGARTSGGTTLYRNVDVDETEDAIKATAGQIYWLHAMNLTDSVVYLHFYNATTGNVTVGTTTPDLTFPLPTQGDTNGAGFTLTIPNGVEFDTAITVACATTLGGSGGPSANGVIVNAGFA